MFLCLWHFIGTQYHYNRVKTKSVPENNTNTEGIDLSLEIVVEMWFCMLFVNLGTLCTFFTDWILNCYQVNKKISIYQEVNSLTAWMRTGQIGKHG